MKERGGRGDGRGVEEIVHGSFWGTMKESE